MLANSWSIPLRSALVRGAGAGVASAAVVAACSERETGSTLAGINAVSHWAWGDAEARRDGFSLKYTGVGALTHLAAATMWAFVFDLLFASGRRAVTLPRLLSESAAMSAMACAVDYTITPKRFTPGYELRLSKRSLLATYVAFAGGLALGSLLLPRGER
ncbi:MAG TPA: hypothetical protein VJV77_07725 [Casimicrobiaceae bacterium]|nr:hypothetical protein [Casimicrobiaceae bacterium]